MWPFWLRPIKSTGNKSSTPVGSGSAFDALGIQVSHCRCIRRRGSTGALSTPGPEDRSLGHQVSCEQGGLGTVRAGRPWGSLGHQPGMPP